jgi:peptide/nickel transport system permease protein
MNTENNPNATESADGVNGPSSPISSTSPASRPDTAPSKAPLPADPAKNIGTMTQWQLIRLRFARHRLATAAIFVLLCLYAMAIFAEFVAPYNANQKFLEYIYAPPHSMQFSLKHGIHSHPIRMERDPATLTTQYVEESDRILDLRLFVKGTPYKLWGLIPMQRHLFGVAGEARETSEPFFLLGADKYGRDIFSRIVYGARISLSIGLVSIAVSFVLGLSIGGISGYFGGVFDLVIQRLIEILQSIPTLPLWIALGAIMPADWSALRVYFGITIVLSFIGWTGLARTVRSKLLSLREEDYAVAARLLGAGHGRIIFRHLIPGFASHIIVTLTLAVPGMILGETALSFLGLGLRPPLVSWGVMLQDTLDLDILSRHPWIIMPTVFVVLTVLAFNFVGDGLRDAADPYH